MKFKIFFIFLLLSIPNFSQEYLPTQPLLKADSLVSTSRQYNGDSLLDKNSTTNDTVYPKNFDRQFQSKYKSADFDYTTVKPRESLWQKLQKRIIQLLETVFGKGDSTKTAIGAENILRIFAILIVGVVLYFLIKFLLNKEGNFFFSKKNKNFTILQRDLQENIHEINFTESILQFELQKDYRSAIRYHFLFVLKKLSDRKFLLWNPEKTNKDYLNELKNTNLKTGFQELSHIFDHIWYGDFKIDETRYDLLKKKFSQFKF